MTVHTHSNLADIPYASFRTPTLTPASACVIAAVPWTPVIVVGREVHRRIGVDGWEEPVGRECANRGQGLQPRARSPVDVVRESCHRLPTPCSTWSLDLVLLALDYDGEAMLGVTATSTIAGQ